MAKAEVAELQRAAVRSTVDVEYLKAVLLGAFQSGELPPTSTMLPVLARLLAFSPDELKRLDHPRATKKVTARRLSSR